MKNLTLAFILWMAGSVYVQSQPVPTPEENIPFLMVFGNQSQTSWGDDDFSQVFFILIPEEYKDPFFIRVFDPEVGGEIDELNDTWNTRMTYAVYGGTGCWSHPDAQNIDPVGNYKSGILMATKTFGENSRYDNDWYAFGPFNPAEGEYSKDHKGYLFKIICEGVTGDDGNMYRYYISMDRNENKSIEGANAFCYEYSFRMWNTPDQVSHIYPFVDEETLYIWQKNFDWDDDGYIRVVSVAKQGQKQDVSGEDNWKEDRAMILKEEVGTSLDFQFIKKKTPYVVKNNNVVVSVKNQRGENLEFYTNPIGGVPKYKYSIKVRKKSNN